jgi:ZipA-like protein with FtsZ-binding domain
MSDLQLSLLVIGAAVVAAVCLYNWLQERSYRRRISQSFAGAHDDILLKAGIESAMTDGRLEPQIVSQDDLDEAGAPRASPPSAVAESGEGIDPILDFTVKIDADTPVADGVIDELTSKTASLGKPVRISGFDPQAGAWSEVARGEGGRYTRLRVALQLVNRTGPVGSARLMSFCDTVRNCAERISAAVDCPDPQAALEQARDLDAFCAGVDVAVGVNVVAEGGGMFSGAKIRELAQNAGFKLEPDGVFHYSDEHRRTLFTLDNHEPAPFLPERIRSLSTKGLTLLLDVPRAAAGGDVLERMIGIANEFAAALGGLLVDDNRATLSETGIARIRDQVRSIHATMDARGIPAGSPRALRLFSG